jgi:DNA-binding response OmpR family regulator
MPKVLLVTPAPGSLATLSAALLAMPGVKVSWETSGERALAAASESRPDLIVVDEQVRGMSAQSLINRLLLWDAMVNTAVVSGRPSEEFHEVYEGLGIMAQLPLHPGRAEAESLMQRLGELSPAVA